MDRAELQELASTLRSENEELRDERDDLKQKLAKIRQSLSAYLDADRGGKQEESTASSSFACEGCGDTFESKAGLHGHKSHCDGTKSSVDDEDLQQLAEELPELSDHQSSQSHDNATPDEELENLNHLLQGSM